MLKDLVKIANKLDSLGLTKEADVIDTFLNKIAKYTGNPLAFKVLEGNTFLQMCKDNGDTSVSVQDQIDLNKSKNKNFNPDKLRVGQTVYFYAPEGAEVPVGAF
jgi:antitoxin component of RelBE/YafQ-DinJ toxin-antitoxin module